MWLKNWGWLKDPQPGPDYEKAAERARDHVEQHNVLATDTLHKPLVLEEFGLPRDHERYAPDSPTTAATIISAACSIRWRSPAGRAGRLQGANFWTWGGEGRAGAGKPDSAPALTGDPFCEPQGLNSVFDTDQSTLAVIAQANEKLAALEK
jgi:mannan endo-1,4-beta-mannosidase